MQRAGQLTNGLHLPKKVDTKANGNGNGYKSVTAQNNEGVSGPTMKGNIGPTNKANLMVDVHNNMQRNLFSQMAEEFDIDNVIPKVDQKEKASE